MQPIQPKEQHDVLLIGARNSGKSSIGGGLICNAGGVDKRTFEKLKKMGIERGYEGYNFHRLVMDYLLKGSQQCNFYIKPWTFETKKYLFNITDSFGDSDLILRALTYKKRVGSALLIVSASFGEFEQGLEETLSQIEFVCHLGVRQVVVIVNKMDTVKWSEERFIEISQCVSAHLQQHTLTYFTFIPLVSNISSDNFSVSESPFTPWYRGLSLLETLDTLKVEYPSEEPLCVQIQDVFITKKFGIVLNGYVVAGVIQVNSVINVLPLNILTQIKSIHNFGYYGYDQNNFVSFNISHERFEDFHNKTKLLVRDANNSSYESFKMFDGILNVKLPVLIREGDQMILKFGASKISCKISRVVSKLSKNAKTIDDNPNRLECKAIGVVRIEVSESICIQKFNKQPSLSHFEIICVQKGVIANGIVIDTYLLDE